MLNFLGHVLATVLVVGLIIALLSLTIVLVIGTIKIVREIWEDMYGN